MILAREGKPLEEMLQEFIEDSEPGKDTDELPDYIKKILKTNTDELRV